MARSEPNLIQRIELLERRLSDLEATAEGVTDHGGLDGLTDDDHSIYLLVAGSRAVSWFLPAPAFKVCEGSPSEGTVGASEGYFSTWRLDDTVEEAVCSEWAAPISGNVNMTVYYCMESASAGNVRILIRSLDQVAEGETCEGSGNTFYTEDAVPGTAKYLGVCELVSSRAVTALDIMRITFQREGQAGGDTASGDLHFMGVLIQYT